MLCSYEDLEKFMKKLLTFFVPGFFALFISSSPICSINQELNKDTVSKLSDFRKQTINTCLSCKESTCKLKEWPEAQKGDANVCKLSLIHISEPTRPY